MCVVDLCNCDYLSDVVMVINRMWTSDPNAHAICDDVRRPFNDRIEKKKGMFSFVHMQHSHLVIFTLFAGLELELVAGVV